MVCGAFDASRSLARRGSSRGSPTVPLVAPRASLRAARADIAAGYADIEARVNLAGRRAYEAAKAAGATWGQAMDTKHRAESAEWDAIRAERDAKKAAEAA